MRFPIPLVVELNDEQLADWAAKTSIAEASGWVRAKDGVEGIRGQVLEAVSAHFDGLGIHADVSIKR